MIYLSRLLLDPRSRRAQAEQRNPYEMHRTLSRAFGEGEAIWHEARCLFRVEEARETDGIGVLIQSRLEPDWDRISVGTDYWLEPPLTKKLALRLPVGIRLAFRLRANPTICQEGKRKPLRGEDEQLRWLERKADSNGFRLCQARVSRTEIVQFTTAAGHPTTFQAVLYDGVLAVSDAEQCVQAVEGGIGSGKGFGFGLLSVARVGI
jgi:CRISPR system Cascade subunit CasE